MGVWQELANQTNPNLSGLHGPDSEHLFTSKTPLRWSYYGSGFHQRAPYILVSLRLFLLITAEALRKAGVETLRIEDTDVVRVTCSSGARAGLQRIGRLGISRVP